MIQPLRATRETWRVDWFDLHVPIQFGAMFIMPTCIYVIHRLTGLLVGHEFVRELDQRRAEMLIHHLFQERGIPDEIQIPDIEEWDEAVWQGLSREYHCEVQLIEDDREDAETSEYESIRQRLDAMVSGPAQTLLASMGPKYIAQGLVQGLKHVRSIDKKRALIGKALELAEDLPEALVELADLDLQDGNLDAAAENFAKAAAGSAGFHIAGEPGCYIRARHGQLFAAWQRGDLTQAIQVGEELLAANQIDHSGVRFLLPLLELLAGQVDEAQEFFGRYQQLYPNDLEDPGFHFGWALSLVDQDREKEASDKYRTGMIQNLYIAPLLLDVPEPAPDIWQHNDRGDLQYAVDFLNSFGLLWERDAAAVRFLREMYTEATPFLDKLIALRQKMADFQDHRYEPRHREIWHSLVEREQELIRNSSSS
jgi:tetratricopeptide (TPR) repeat protein